MNENSIQQKTERAAKLDGDCLPYGIWFCRNGREVLFDRNHCALWQKAPDGTVTKADPGEWVHWIEQDYFYDARTRPRSRKYGAATKNKLAAILASWGVP